jgi:thioredoxin reductase (NADPH)
MPPLPFETDLPGVLVAGDARYGSIKRVAAAVGEGSVAVGPGRQYLTTTAQEDEPVQASVHRRGREDLDDGSQTMGRVVA